MKVSIRSLALLAIVACSSMGQLSAFTRAQLLACVRQQVPGVGEAEWVGVTEVVKALWRQEGVEYALVDYAVLVDLCARIRLIPGCEGLDYDLLVQEIAVAEFGPVRAADPEDAQIDEVDLYAEQPDPDDHDFAAE